ncbi:DUF2061 domain-containing protein [Spongiivirga citrea]|uniref:DUF2061 domain-containing protein n=1 Tax=Spongiivirga citrea TaxID=1481457 RepID=A0A6M0CL72_9FLAO|nr:DUF2061 domain-containing protein [Spongiivirga citrea]NER16167.1 DUF2061 domain-containing protein [Spongiivirga citrea]
MILDILRPDQSKQTSDSPKISLLKTISWRIIGTLDTMIISYLLTGDMKIAFGIGGIEVVSKMVLYYFHERIWNKVKRH